ncbi:MAG TPA: aldolase/citrate lyase family protein [Chloroflexota bacterium]|jgi:4-hydroxy-2-oxoheptanedioate aldolase|nr:aldolase/citrate lyase family protein [Chloroflexota bacterium]
MGPNAVKRKLAAGETALGIFVSFDAPFLLEIFGYCGFDFLVIDAEHGALDPHHVEGMVRAAEGTDATPLVRVPQNSPQILLRYLDVGPQGVLIPWCQSAAEAEAAVQSTRYYPEGRRGLAGVRAAKYGVGQPLPDYVQQANAELMVVVQIETTTALDALPEMLQVPGVDVFFIGPNDLSQSLGYPARPDEPVVQEAIGHALDQIMRAGKTAGIMVRNAQEAQRYRDRGVRFITISVGSLVASAARGYLATVRE